MSDIGDNQVQTSTPGGEAGGSGSGKISRKGWMVIGAFVLIVIVGSLSTCGKTQTETAQPTAQVAQTK